MRDGQVLVEEILPPGREHLENIAPAFDRVMSSLDAEPRSLDGFGVAVGPGSFSGIRVGMSFVKGLALALGKPLAGISSLEILASQVLLDGERGVAIIDARRNEVYACAYQRQGNRLVPIHAPQLIRAAEFPQYARGIGQPLVLCGDSVVESLADSSSNAARVVTLEASPAMCAQIAWERLNDGNADGLHALTPLYIRRSDAEEKKRVPPSPGNLSADKKQG